MKVASIGEFLGISALWQAAKFRPTFRCWILGDSGLCLRIVYANSISLTIDLIDEHEKVTIMSRKNEPHWKVHLCMETSLSDNKIQSVSKVEKPSKHRYRCLCCFAQHCNQTERRRFSRNQQRRRKWSYQSCCQQCMRQFFSSQCSVVEQHFWQWFTLMYIYIAFDLYAVYITLHIKTYRYVLIWIDSHKMFCNCICVSAKF